MRTLSKRSLLWGLAGSIGLAALYALIVGGASAHRGPDWVGGSDVDTRILMKGGR